MEEIESKAEERILEDFLYLPRLAQQHLPACDITKLSRQAMDLSTTNPVAPVPTSAFTPHSVETNASMIVMSCDSATHFFSACCSHLLLLLWLSRL